MLPHLWVLNLASYILYMFREACYQPNYTPSPGKAFKNLISDRFLLCSPGCLAVTMKTRMTLNSQKCVPLLPCGGVKGVVCSHD